MGEAADGGHLLRPKVARGVVFLLFRYGVGFGANLLGSIVLINVLGAEVWGGYAISFLLLNSFMFLSFGVWGYLVQRPVPLTPADLNGCLLIQHGALLTWTAVILLWLEPWLGLRFAGSHLRPMVYGATIGGYFYCWRWFLLGLAERKLDYRTVALAGVSDAVTFNTVAIVGALLGHGVGGIAVGNVARGLVGAGVAFQRTRPSLGWKTDWPSVRRIVRFGVPFFAFSTLQALPANLAPTFAGLFLGSAATLGLIWQAYRLLEYPKVLVTIAFRISMSSYSRLQETGGPFRAAAMRGLSLLFHLIGLAIVVMAALAPLWVPFLYGPEWKETARLMGFLAVPFVVTGCYLFLAVVLCARGHSTDGALFQGIYNAVYWSSAAVFIPRLRALGLPAAEWLALLCGGVLLLLCRRRGLPIPVFPYLMKLALGAGVVWVCHQLIAQQQPWVAVGVVFLFLVSWVSFMRADLRSVRQWLPG